MKPKIEVSDVSKSYSRDDDQVLMAIRSVNLTIEAGRFVILLGPSGCGKSTLLNMIAGFDHPTAGVIEVDGRPVTDPGPERGVVFQEFVLYPWLTVLGNVRIGLDVQRRMSRGERTELARKLVRQVGLEGFEARFPHTLSGGMKQRVAIARTLSTDPEILLMDEPFGALDAQTRSNLQRDLLALWQGTNKTVLFVTHSVQEALLLGDEIAVFTSRPAVIKKHVRVDLPRPRNPSEQRFLELEREILSLLVEDERPDAMRS